MAIMTLTCSVGNCVHNDGFGRCECRNVYISDVEGRGPMCMSAVFVAPTVPVKSRANERTLERDISDARGASKLTPENAQR